MSPQARFRRGLLKCLSSRYCHSEFLKKSADWYFEKTYQFFNAVCENSSSVSLPAGSRLSLLFLALNLLYGLMVNHTYFHFKYIMLHRSLCVQHFLGNPFCFFPCIPLRAHAVFYLHIPNKDIPVPSSIWIAHIP